MVLVLPRSSALPTRPSSAPASRVPLMKTRKSVSMQNRELTSNETWREEIHLLKQETNKLTQDLVQAHAANARLQQQNGLQARQIETLLGRGGQASGGSIRRQHERSLIAKRLREQLDGLRASLRERDATIASLKRSHRHTLILELEAAKEEYFNECARLRRALTAQRDAFGGSPVLVAQDDEDSPTRPQSASSSRRLQHQPQKKKKKKKTVKKTSKSADTEDVIIFDDAGSEDSGTGVVAGHDALRLLYREARQTNIESLAEVGPFYSPDDDVEKRQFYYSRRPDGPLSSSPREQQYRDDNDKTVPVYSSSDANDQFSPQSTSSTGYDDGNRRKANSLLGQSSDNMVENRESFVSRDGNMAFEKGPHSCAEQEDEHSQTSKVVHMSSVCDLSGDTELDASLCVEGILRLNGDDNHTKSSGEENRSPTSKKRAAVEADEAEAAKAEEERRKQVYSHDDGDGNNNATAAHTALTASLDDEYSSDADYNDASFSED